MEEVVRILQANFINLAAINWVVFKQNLLAKVSGTNTIDQAYPAVVSAIVALSDKHNMFATARLVKESKLPTANPPLYTPTSQFLRTSATSDYLGCRQPGKARRVHHQRAGPN